MGDMEFEGSLNVLARIEQKRRWMAEGDARHEEIRPALLIQAGIMLGVYGGGETIALQQAGHTRTFDIVKGVSTGAPLASYFVAGQSHIGVPIYWEYCCSKTFLSKRRYISSHIMDIDYLCNIFRGTIPEKRLDINAIRTSRTRLILALTNFETGAGILVDAADLPDLIEGICASIAIPGVTHGNVVINGVRYCDGVGGFPLAARALAAPYGITDFVILANRPKRYGVSIAENIVRPVVMRGYPKQTQHTFKTREVRLQEEHEYVRTTFKDNYCILWADDTMSAYEQDPAVLRACSRQAQIHFSDLLRRAAR